MRAVGKVKAVALDLDGTLTNARKEITPRVRDAVRRAAEAGTSIILASGRPVVGMAHVADSLELGNIGGYVLSNNGSKIIEWRSKDVVLDRVLPREAVLACCEAAHRFGATALCYDEKGLYSEDPSATYVEKERYNNSAMATKVDDLAEAVSWDPNKMMVVGEPDALQPALEWLQSRLQGTASVFLSEPYFIEIAPSGIRKDAALEILMAQLGTSLDELMAVGDGFNDIPMLECAGMAVAMGNAYPEVKKHADWIAPSNEEDGAAVAIERFVLEEGPCC